MGMIYILQVNLENSCSHKLANLLFEELNKIFA